VTVFTVMSVVEEDLPRPDPREQGKELEKWATGEEGDGYVRTLRLWGQEASITRPLVFEGGDNPTIHDATISWDTLNSSVNRGEQAIHVGWREGGGGTYETTLSLRDVTLWNVRVVVGRRARLDLAGVTIHNAPGEAAVEVLEGGQLEMRQGRIEGPDGCAIKVARGGKATLFRVDVVEAKSHGVQAGETAYGRGAGAGEASVRLKRVAVRGCQGAGVLVGLGGRLLCQETRLAGCKGWGIEAREGACVKRECVKATRCGAGGFSPEVGRQGLGELLCAGCCSGGAGWEPEIVV